jgi:cell division protein FtsW (lipid II flippase)
VNLIRKPASHQEILQRRLLVLAGIFLFAYNLALTFAPAARFHTWHIALHWGNWAGFVVWLIAFVILESELNRLLPGHDPYLLPLISVLAGWGLVTVWRLDTTLAFKQTIWLAVSAVSLWGCIRYPSTLSLLRKYRYLWLIGGILLTALTFFFGTYPAGEGPRLWLDLGGFYFQPSEPLKLFLIIFLAAYLSERLPLSFNFWQLIVPTLLMFAAALGVLLAQRDLGTASLFIILYIVILYLAIGKKRLLILAGLFIGAAGFLGYRLFSIVRLRVNTWLNPWQDPSGTSYQIVQSLLGIASGGVFGRGPGLGSPGIIPVAHSDFIFSAIAEETGLMGTFALFALLAIFTILALRIALRATNQFQRFLAAGITVYTILQSILIIGGNLRLLPLTGVTLPFMSYGGSSLLTSFLSAALLLLISQTGDKETAPLQNNSSFQIVGSFLLVGIFTLSLSNGWWAFIRSDDLLLRSDNPRYSIGEIYVKRGSILDQHNQTLVETTGQPGSYSRLYRYPSMSPITGYDSAVYGQSGIEAALNPFLEGIQGNPSSVVWWDHFAYGQTPNGLNIRLSIDLPLQQQADRLLIGHSGALVLFNAETGEILAMSSHPNIDPNQLSAKMPGWLKDPASPLLNRVTQAQYPMGSAIGAFLYAHRLSQGEGLPQIPGESGIYLKGKYLPCAIMGNTKEDWKKPITDGCPAPILTLADQLGGSGILKSLSDFGFTTSPTFLLPVADTLASTAPLDIRDFLFGSAQMKVSPLQMAIATAIISNDGYMLTPRLVTAYQNIQQTWITFALPAKARTPVTNADLVATNLASDSISGWETVSLAESDDTRITWYIAGTAPDWKGTPLSLALVLEEDNPLLAQQIGRALFNNATLP